MTLILGEQFLKYITSKHVTIEDFYILLCLYLQDKKALDAYFSGFTPWQRVAMMNKVRLIGKVKIEYPELVEFDFDNYTLTNEGKEIIDYYSGLTQVSKIPNIQPQPQPPILSEFTLEGKKIEEDLEFDTFISDYRNLFPEGANNGGASLRSNDRDVKDKFSKFFKKYKYNRATILKATQLYIEGLRGNKSFCIAAHYFILKDNSSQLASYCELILNNGGGMPKDSFEKTM